MDVLTGHDPVRLNGRVRGFLAERAARHSVILTRLSRALAGERSQPLEAELWWWVEQSDGEVVAALMQTPPHGAYLAADDETAVRALARTAWVARPHLPSVGGPDATAEYFADEWMHCGGPAAEVIMRQRLLEADRLVEPPAPPGRDRLATRTDVPLLRAWGEAFTDEATPGGIRMDHVTARVEAGLLHVWDVDGRPVSMAAVTPPEVGVSRVQLVYTPPQQRGHGYAAACVAAVTREALAEAGRTCMLYTDAANPTSNALYERLGYRVIGTATDLAFCR